MSQRPVYTNRLIHEKSPYLLQHAHNPVDWFPWGEEAFKLAQEKDKPIFLSIGYASCHWCHVMDKESFQNVELAQLMNEAFVNIKVDREELPQIDGLYMELAQAMMTGGAGWPLNLVLTPEKEPFFASTYLPADATRGMLGMKQLIHRVNQIWSDHDEKEMVSMQAGKIVDIFAGQGMDMTIALPNPAMLLEAEEFLFKAADPIHGGMKGAPKFPVTFQGTFLLRRCRMSSDSRALFYVERTLDRMAQGGIYDQLGGGFARYTVDEQWLIPHFEKMLCDNATLATAYLEAWQYTKNPLYKDIALQTFHYLLREMKSPQGPFYTAQDADTEGSEGFFYTWSWDEMHRHLDADATLFCEYYGTSPAGNFKGRNILHVPHAPQDFARMRKIDAQDLKKVILELSKKMFEIRNRREHPAVDDKVITAYNSLAIAACAIAGQQLGEPLFTKAAVEAAEFIHKNLLVEGHLKRRWREGEAKYDATLDDYAFTISAYLTLFECHQGTHYFERALELIDRVENDFKDDSGAYYSTNGQDPSLLIRRAEFFDSSEPSGNAVMAENFLRLYQMTGDGTYQKKAESILAAAKESIEIYPPGMCYHLQVLQRYYDLKSPTLVIALNEQKNQIGEIEKVLNEFYLPHKVVIWVDPADREIQELLPVIRDKKPINGQTAFYLCFADRCAEPIKELESLRHTLSKL
jgi:uncharacterized protein YyaL (SSP411 family)